MTFEELKPCPFCGSPYANKPQVMSYYNSYSGRQYFVECTFCGATSRHSGSEEYVVEQWNKRVEKTQYKQRTVRIAELLTEAYNLMSEEEEENNLLYKGYYENMTIDEAMDMFP